MKQVLIISFSVVGHERCAKEKNRVIGCYFLVHFFEQICLLLLKDWVGVKSALQPQQPQKSISYFQLQLWRIWFLIPAQNCLLTSKFHWTDKSKINSDRKKVHIISWKSNKDYFWPNLGLLRSKCSQNEVKMQSKFSQNAVKTQSKCSQNAVRMQSEYSQNALLGVLINWKIFSLVCALFSFYIWIKIQCIFQ